MRSTTLPMDTFGKEAVERYARERRSSPGAVVRNAALYYLADRDSERRAWFVPRFARELPTEARMAVEIDDATWAAVEDEAARQDVSPAVLLHHAVLYFLADA